MAKKKNDAIMAHLHALKANVPTNSRRKETPADDIGIKSSETKPAKTKPSEIKPSEIKPSKRGSAGVKLASPVKKPSVKPIAEAARKPIVEPPAPKQVPAPAPAVKTPLVEPATALMPAEKPPESEITVTDFGPGFMEIMIKNIDSMTRARDVLAGELGKVNAIIINTFQHSMLVSFDMYKINSNYILEMLNSAMSPFCRPKD